MGEVVITGPDGLVRRIDVPDGSTVEIRGARLSNMLVIDCDFAGTKSPPTPPVISEEP